MMYDAILGMMTTNGRDNVVAFRREGHDVVMKAIWNVLKENEEVAIWWRLGNEKTVKKSKYLHYNL